MCTRNGASFWLCWLHSPTPAVHMMLAVVVVAAVVVAAVVVAAVVAAAVFVCVAAAAVVAVVVCVAVVVVVVVVAVVVVVVAAVVAVVAVCVVAVCVVAVCVYTCVCVCVSEAKGPEGRKLNSVCVVCQVLFCCLKSLCLCLVGAPCQISLFGVKVVEPMRSGLGDVVPAVCKYGPPCVVGVWCTLESMSSEIATLVKEGGYEVVEIVVVDFFPHTSHIETVVKLT